MSHDIDLTPAWEVVEHLEQYDGDYENAGKLAAVLRKLEARRGPFERPLLEEVTGHKPPHVRLVAWLLGRGC